MSRTPERPGPSWVLQVGKEHAVASGGTMVPLGGRKRVCLKREEEEEEEEDLALPAE